MYSVKLAYKIQKLLNELQELHSQIRLKIDEVKQTIYQIKLDNIDIEK